LAKFIGVVNVQRAREIMNQKFISSVHKPVKYAGRMVAQKHWRQRFETSIHGRTAKRTADKDGKSIGEKYQGIVYGITEDIAR
jgi:hypothetical protein